MLGQLLNALDDPKVAIGVLAALNQPSLSERITAIAGATGCAPADVIASTVRGFLDTASDDHWLQLVGIMNRAEDPGLSAVRAILNKALPEHVL
ncbi:MAG TPA: hypothetical protein PKE16_00370 [Hyphomicrobium sp.]|nr:hypothetical protein [Hyphomicrobium sp.]